MTFCAAIDSYLCSNKHLWRDKNQSQANGIVVDALLEMIKYWAQLDTTIIIEVIWVVSDLDGDICIAYSCHHLIVWAQMITGKAGVL